MALDKSNKKEENISVDVSELLSQRENDLKALEQQKEYMTNFINMLRKIDDVIDGKEGTLGQWFSNFLLPSTCKYNEDERPIILCLINNKCDIIKKTCFFQI